MTIELPQSLLPPERVNPRFLLLYGPRKVGKTTNLAKLPNNLIIDLEEGTDYVSALKIKIPYERDSKKCLSSYEHFLQVCSAIKAKNPRPYNYVTIDTVDILEEWAVALALVRYKDSPMGKTFKGDSVEILPNGAGYKWIREAFREILQETMPLARTVIYVGHVRDKSMEGVGTTADSKELDLIGKNRAIMCSVCDTVGHVYRDPMGKIGINFQSHQAVLCSSRVSHVTGKDFKFTGSDIDWNQIFIKE